MLKNEAATDKRISLNEIEAEQRIALDSKELQLRIAMEESKISSSLLDWAFRQWEFQWQYCLQALCQLPMFQSAWGIK